MGKAVASNGQFRALVGGLLTTKDNAIPTIDGTLIQEAIDECSSGKTQTEFIKWINNGCQLTTVLANVFTVGDMFRHRAEEGDRRLYLSDNTQNWLIKPNLKKVIPIRTDPRKLSEYRLPKNMKDTPIQEATGNPGFMSEEEFLCIMYLSIFQPELGKQVLGFSLQKDKWYIFHVMVSGKKVAFSVGWDDDEWDFRADDFDGDGGWVGGHVFVSLAAA